MLNADALSQLRQLKTNIEENKVVFPGTVKATNGRFGFVALDEGRDVFLPPEEMQGFGTAQVPRARNAPALPARPSDDRSVVEGKSLLSPDQVQSESRIHQKDQ